MRKLLIAVAMVFGLSFAVVPNANASVYFPCSVGVTTDSAGRTVAWGNCPYRPSEKPGTTEWRVVAKFCESGSCVTKWGAWHSYGYGIAQVKSGNNFGNGSWVDLRYR